ncbi:MAG: hypothetical protein KBT20_07580 [Bacteroidales bacterium]|nr:hypothetical protein [Candidatus Liminaster caballi]
MKPSELYTYIDNQSKCTRGLYDPKEEVGYSIPDNGRYLVYYYIRIDGNIPGEDAVNLPASAYFPRTKTGKTMISDLNHGYVQANVDWRTNFKFSKYIYSKDGSAVESIIVEEPTLEDLVNANQGAGDDFNGYIENQDKLHFIWYACKKQDADHIWHIDGILTSKDRTDITDTEYGQEIVEKFDSYGMTDDEGNVLRDGHVEVDVHQQKHTDWNEIKTSIHLRDTVTAEVFLPIDYVAQADDFDIRVGQDYEYITEILDSKITIGDTEYTLTATIQHEEGGIRITVEPNKEALAAARQLYGDGITYEIHSYVTSGIPQENIWEKLRNTTVKVTPYTTVLGQVTSAYFDDSVVF